MGVISVGPSRHLHSWQYPGSASQAGSDRAGAWGLCLSCTPYSAAGTDCMARFQTDPRPTTGHLWQGRYGSVAMDETHFVAALRYVALNPVRARLTGRAEDWPWASTRALIAGVSDGYVRVEPALERTGDFAAFLGSPFDEEIGRAHV